MQIVSCALPESHRISTLGASGGWYLEKQFFIHDGSEDQLICWVILSLSAHAFNKDMMSVLYEEPFLRLFSQFLRRYQVLVAWQQAVR